MKSCKNYLVILILVLLAAAVFGDVKLPGIFSSNMVIQQQKPFIIWGTATPGEKITVAIAGETELVVADKDGNWSRTFPAMEASFVPIKIKIVGKNKVILNNVLVGEVWLCSGQSNMAWPVSRAKNGDAEVAKANNKNIRLYYVPRKIALTPQAACPASWEICTPESAKRFSAVGYFFGRELQRELNVPIGLINSNWGGTIIEAWTPIEYLEKVDFMKARMKFDKATRNEQAGGMGAYKRRVKEICEENAKRAARVESPKEQAKISAPFFDDSKWKTAKLPCKWEKHGLGGYDGIVWYRKNIDVPAKMAGKDMVLCLGGIDDFDMTFFNGQKVGSKGVKTLKRKSAKNIKRKYTIPGKLVKAGKNVIAVQVVDDGGDGGLCGPASNMCIIPADRKLNKKITLAGEWKYLSVCAFRHWPRNPNNPNQPSRLYMGMIHPIEGYAIRGVIWYQGESNAKRAKEYKVLMPAMIQAWRDKWDDQSIVFLQTQLANYSSRSKIPRDTGWARLREAQAMTARNDPLAGMAVIIDIGNPKNIHPRNKQDVGKRLSRQARKIAYKQDIQHSSPMFKSMKVKDGNVYVTFDYTYGGLYSKGGKVKGFAVAGKDGKFVWANAIIVGEKIVLSTKEVGDPVTIRYAWDNNPECTVYNSIDLPMCPFEAKK